MYEKIQHPKTGKWYSSSGSVGSKLIQQYANKLEQLGSGSANHIARRKVSVSDKIGNSVLNGYLSQLSGGMMNPSGDRIRQQAQARRQRTLESRAQIKGLTDMINGEITNHKDKIIRGNSILADEYRDTLKRKEYFKKNPDSIGSRAHSHTIGEELREFRNEFERLAIRTFLTHWPMILEQTREAGIPEEVIDTVKADFSGIW